MVDLLGSHVVIAELLYIGSIFVWIIGLILLGRSNPKLGETFNKTSGTTGSYFNIMLNDPNVSKSLIYVMTYVVSSALAVPAWNQQFAEGGQTLVFLETIIFSAFIMMIAFFLLPRIENLKPSEYGLTLESSIPKDIDLTPYRDPWTNKVHIPGYVSPSTSVIIAIILAVPIALLFQVPIYVIQHGYFPLDFGIGRLDLFTPNLILGLSSALVEEILYRGLLFSSLNKAFPSTKTNFELRNNFVQALFFTGFHLLYLTGLVLQPLSPSNPIFVYLGQAFLIAFLLGLVRTQTKSIVPGMIIHCTINVIGLIMI